jgi:hypothetical protein
LLRLLCLLLPARLLLPICPCGLQGRQEKLCRHLVWLNIRQPHAGLQADHLDRCGAELHCFFQLPCRHHFCYFAADALYFRILKVLRCLSMPD